MNERDILLKKIRAEDFALYETVLFLDAHPRDEKALAYYASRKEAAEKLRNEFTRKYGPLTVYDVCDKTCWRWIEGPWPWEREAN